MSMHEMFAMNRRRAFERMPDDSALLLTAATPKIRSGDTPYPYCQDKNFYYLTGHNHRRAAVLLMKQGGKMDTQLYVLELTPLQKHWFGHLPGPDEVRRETGIENVKTIRDLPDALSRAVSAIQTLYLDFSPVSIHEPLSDALQMADAVRRRCPHLSIRRAYPLLAALREVKADWEVERIRKAVELTRKGMTRMLNHMTPGTVEYQIEAWFNLTLHLHRSTPAFPTIVAGGKNATTLHYTALSEPLTDGDLLLLDLGAEFNHYSADISRTFPVSGRFTERQRALYQLVLDANIQTINAVKPGISFKELNAVARDILASGMKALRYITDEKEISSFYTHGVSHPLGLDTHDVFSGSFSTLRPGMVITVEPGLYLEKEGIGIRIEDDVVVTEEGCENLSRNIPKEADAVEEWIREAKRRQGL